MTLALSKEDVFQKDIKVINSAFAEYKKRPSLISKPLSELSHSIGLTPQKIMEKFIPLICGEKDLKELCNYAGLGVDILEYFDRNMWRTKLPEEFFLIFDTINDIIEEVYSDGEPWMKRRAIKLHMRLADTQADKRRFIEYIATEDKLQEIARAMESQKQLEGEIIDV